MIKVATMMAAIIPPLTPRTVKMKNCTSSPPQLLKLHLKMASELAQLIVSTLASDVLSAVVLMR